MRRRQQEQFRSRSPGVPEVLKHKRAGAGAGAGASVSNSIEETVELVEANARDMVLDEYERKLQKDDLKRATNKLVYREGITNTGSTNSSTPGLQMQGLTPGLTDAGEKTDGDGELPNTKANKYYDVISSPRRRKNQEEFGASYYEAADAVQN